MSEKRILDCRLKNHKSTNLPKGWTEVDFEQCIDIPKGPFIKIPQKQYLSQGKYPIIDQGSEFITGYTNNKSDLFKGELPAVIFGDHTRMLKFVDFDFAIGADGTKILEAKQGINPKYLFYYLRTIELPSRGYSRHYRYLRENRILLAPENEQHRIVRKIENLLDRLNKTKQELAKIPPLLKKFRQSVLAKAFSGELTKDIRKESIECVWQRKRLKDICEDIKSINPLNYPERVYKYIDISSISNTTNEIKELKEFVGKDAPSRARRPVQKNDILFSNVRTYLKNIAIVKLRDSNLLCSTGFCVLRPKSMLRSEFLFYKVLSDKFIEEVTGTQTGTHYPATSDRKVLSMEIVLPPLNEQDYAISKIQEFFSQANAIEKSVKIAQAHCEKLTQSILAKAFRGELVEQDPNDETAEELLKRIKLVRET